MVVILDQETVERTINRASPHAQGPESVVVSRVVVGWPPDYELPAPSDGGSILFASSTPRFERKLDSGEGHKVGGP
jgi:hypothetical protein